MNISIHFEGCGAENKCNVKAFQVLPVLCRLHCALDAWSTSEEEAPVSRV